MNLQQLKIPAKWQIVSNSFYEIDPDFNEEDMQGTWWYFGEDIFQAMSTSEGLILDLGWFPSHKKEGRFLLTLVENRENTTKMADSWQEPLRSFESQNRIEVVEVINQWMNS